VDDKEVSKMSIFWVWVIVGLIAGYLAKRVLHEGPQGIYGDLVVGVIGALVGGWILNSFVHAGVTGFNIGSILVGFVGAAVFLWGLRFLSKGLAQPETAAMMKHGVWGAIFGAVIAIIVGFAWGGWSTRGGAQQTTEAAVLTTRAAICVAQFMKQPNAQDKLKELKDISSWDRATFIEKGGWDKMPGQAEASYTVSRACADGLDLLMGK
jgi:uncharacterized membrane protein YeaQ/YmgE (transglycosylase-associated protein family)